MKHWKAILVFALGLALRLVTLATPGNEDMRDHQIWGAWAVERGMARAYVYDDADYLEKFFFRLNHIPHATTRTSAPTALGKLDHVPDYAPLGISIFAASAWLARLCQGGSLQPGALLDACFNLLPFLSSIGILALGWNFTRRQGRDISWAPLALFWLNPALILHSPIHGYVDPVYAFLGLMGLVALHDRKWLPAVVALAGACLVKPQAVLLVPIAALVIWREGGRQLLRRALLLFAFVTLAAFIPFIATGHFLAAMRGILQVTWLDYVSSNQLNLWWLVNWIAGMASGGPLGGPVGIVRVTDPSSFGFMLIRFMAALLALGLTLLNLRRLWEELRRGNRDALFWAAAIQVYIFTSVSLYPKENHLYGFFIYVLPVVLLARPPISAFYAVLSTVFFLNLFLFDGLGMGWERPGHALRVLFGFDLTILVAALNAALFFWLMAHPNWFFNFTRPEPD
jgi:hypothetical protein